MKTITVRVLLVALAAISCSTEEPIVSKNNDGQAALEKKGHSKNADHQQQEKFWVNQAESTSMPNQETSSIERRIKGSLVALVASVDHEPAEIAEVERLEPEEAVEPIDPGLLNPRNFDENGNLLPNFPGLVDPEKVDENDRRLFDKGLFFNQGIIPERDVVPMPAPPPSVPTIVRGGCEDPTADNFDPSGINLDPCEWSTVPDIGSTLDECLSRVFDEAYCRSLFEEEVEIPDISFWD